MLAARQHLQRGAHEPPVERHQIDASGRRERALLAVGHAIVVVVVPVCPDLHAERGVVGRASRHVAGEQYARQNEGRGYSSHPH